MMALLKPDKIMIVALILIVSTHSITNYLIHIHRTPSQNVQEFNDSVLILEANPVTRFIFSLGNFKYIYSYVLLPAIVVALYWVQRRRLGSNPDQLEAFAVFFLAFSFLNFMNDLSVLLAYLFA